jgi:exonuclease SbcC
MRLHELSVTAFGPFVDTVEVDFDELSAGGLFLLTGDTGSGKTSVLDAVCFALYGEVPGDRHTARHLRSDQAEPQAEPRVTLRLSVGGRTFRFTRSPAWERPKRRGHGTTRVQAHVVVEEQKPEGWVALTNRLDEAGQLVTGLLGMTCTQFTQVAMLPQGRFQAFLRATSAERHDVLQRLFRTRRFEEVERWLVERRLELGRRCRHHHDVCSGIVNRLQEAAGVSTPDEWDAHDLDAVAADGSLERWAAARLTTAGTALDERRAALAAATDAVQRHQKTLDRARALDSGRARGESARRRLEELTASQHHEVALTSALDAHRRAAPVLPQALRVETAASEHHEAAAGAAHHLEEVCSLLGVPASEVDSQLLSSTITRLTEERAVAESWLPRERQLQLEGTRVSALASKAAQLTRRVAERQERAEELVSARAQLDTELHVADALAQRIVPDRAALEAAEHGLEAASEAAQLTTELTAARERLARSTDHAHDLRQAYLDLREQRISGMAAELAGALAIGCSCPVCGSVEHPSPASASAVVGRADEDTARERYESADFECLTVRELVTTLSTRLQGALVRSNGHAVTHWRTSATVAASAAAESAAADRDLTRLRAEVVELDREEKQVATDLTSARVSLEERARERDAATLRRDGLLAELGALLEAHAGVTTVAGLVASHRRALTELEEARSALAARERAAVELASSSSAADAAAAEAGFDSLSDALSAVLHGGEAIAAARTLDERRAARTAAESVLSEEPVLAALAEPAPDLTDLTRRFVEADRSRDEQHAAHEHAVLRAHRLETLVAELAEALAAWTPVRQDHVLTAGLAALVEGKSADNQLRMRLSAYVLSERLRQVVAAANERLGTMTDQRFTLEQTDERGAGEQRGGLSLRVRDEWSGKLRDPATLSGGETFIVSLALALGLADTVSHEAGGTQLDTLFIDEGFGALDASTLDGVMDTLDSLRDGGRVVGLVSHVAELRNRVPAQLEVRKARRGSTLSATVVGG